jgi:hypothetical protein
MEDGYNLRPDWPMALQNSVSISNGVENGTIGHLAVSGLEII